MALVVALPSLTVMVLVVVPDRFGNGVIVTVRFAPLPPKARFALLTRLVLDEAPATLKRPGLVSISPTVNEIAVKVSSLITWSAMPEMVGGLFKQIFSSTVTPLGL